MSADVNSILMEALATGGGQGLNAVATQALLAQLGEDNPAASLLSKYFAERQAVEPESETSGSDQDDEELSQYSREIERAQTRSAETAQALRLLREKIEKVYEELESLRDRNDQLAAAVGACYLCWGEDRQCPVCAGEGRPGFALPDREFFTQFVAPAVHRFQRRRSADRQLSRETDPRMPSSTASLKGD